MELDMRSAVATSTVAVPPSVPSPGMNADEEKLAARIERTIRRQTNDKVRELKIDIRRGRIVLKGRCGTYYCKQLAQHAAMTLSGDETLSNQIEVW